MGSQQKRKRPQILILEDSNGPQTYGIGSGKKRTFFFREAEKKRTGDDPQAQAGPISRSSPQPTVSPMDRTTSALRLRLHITNSEEERANERSL